MKLVVDCRYVRRDGRHDGISRYAAGITAALGRRVPLTMLIDDPRQLGLLPHLPSVRIRRVTSPLEPLIPRAINRLSPDVVFSPMQTSGSIGRRYGLVLTLHDLIYYRHRTPPTEFAWWVRLLWRVAYLSYLPQRVLLNRGDEVVTVSEVVARQIAEHRLTRRPVTVVPNAADEPPVTTVPPPPRAKRIVYMGAFIGYKNVATLVRAAALLPDYELHLLSPVTAAERRGLQRVAEGARLVFHGGVTDSQYRSLLDSATALVSASRDEGFGIPVVEAMTRGLPVVLSDIPIFREVAGDAALYASADDPAAFAAAVRRLEEPGEWSARSQAALDRVREFSWDASAARLLPVLERVAEARSARTGAGRSARLRRARPERGS
jgi:glycosyltransferase involved in cell wall biosynthesis